MRRNSWIFLATLLCVFAPGCKNANKAIADSGQFAQIDYTNSGTVSGVVHFTGTVPERLKIDMDQDPACSLTGGENMTEQFVVNSGAFQNVFVYVKAGLTGKYAPTRTPVVLDQKGCRYVPHVLGVMAGQPLEVRNSDSTMHNVHPETAEAGGKNFDISQAPMGKPVQVFFDKPQIMVPIRCNNHPWMEAYLNVTDNPFFAVTGADGTFTIKGLPPGTYTIAAVQEKLGEQTATVTVAKGETTVKDFSFQMK